MYSYQNTGDDKERYCDLVYQQPGQHIQMAFLKWQFRESITLLPADNRLILRKDKMSSGGNSLIMSLLSII